MSQVIERNTLLVVTGQRIRELRQARGMSQNRLAGAAGLSRVTLTRIENGYQLPDWTAVVNIADALGVAVDALRKN